MSTGQDKEFHILRKIAEGGFGAVYLTKLVHADGFSRLVALKLLHRKWSKNKEVASRMRDEARLLGWLRHRNIVDVMDLTRLDGRVAVVMEYLEAVDCGTILKNAFATKELVPVRAVLEIGAFVASALDAAYNQPPYSGQKPLRVIHRDIKPSNIMVDVHGSVKVLDFGVARADFEEREAATGQMSFGSFDYMSSERIFMEEAVPESDVYSLAATCYELMMTERFGRGRINPDEHLEMIETRIGDLLSGIQIPEGFGDKLGLLFREMLSFEAERRPSPADVSKRMRGLARELPDGALEDWAERVLPNVVEQFQIRTDDGTDPLCGKKLRADPLVGLSSEVTKIVSRDEADESAASGGWAHDVGLRPESTFDHQDTDPGSFMIPTPNPLPISSNVAPQKRSPWAPILVFAGGVFIFVVGVVALIVAILIPGVPS